MTDFGKSPDNKHKLKKIDKYKVWSNSYSVMKRAKGETSV